MITPEIYQNYSDYISTIIESEYTISYMELLMFNTSLYLEALINGSAVIDIKNEIKRFINNDNTAFIEQYTTVDNVITSLQLKIIKVYGDLNSFLQDNNIIVGYYFAQSSDRLGFTIDDENIEYVILESGDTYTVEGDVRIKYDLVDSLTSATVVIYGTSFIVKIVNDQFVWDVGGTGEHIFTYIGDSIARTIGSYTFYVTWTGFSSFLFSVYIFSSPIIYKHWYQAGSSLTTDEAMITQLDLMDTAKADGYTGVLWNFSWWYNVEEWTYYGMRARMATVRAYVTSLGLDFYVGVINASNYTDQYEADGATAEVTAEGYPATNMRFIVQSDGTITADPDDLDVRFPLAAMPGEYEITTSNSPYYITSVAPTAHTPIHVSFRIKYSADYVGNVVAGDGAMVSIIGRYTDDRISEYIFQQQLTNTGTDWTTVDLTFNAQECDDNISFYIGHDGTAGTVTFDLLTFAPGGIVNILRRANTPLVITSEDGLTTYVEGVDFEDATDANIRADPIHQSYWHTVPIMNKVGTALSIGDVVLCSYYHIGFYLGYWRPCLSDSTYRTRLALIIDEIRDELSPDGYFMYIDEVRFAGWDPACTSKGTQGQMLADYVTACYDMIQASDPGKSVWTWSDMFDPYHNAASNSYRYQNRGPYTGSWLGLNSKIGIINWNHITTLIDTDNAVDADGLAAWKRSLDFFASLDNNQILAGFYDTLNVDWEKEWGTYAQDYNYRGAMYTTWENDYTEMKEYFDLIVANERT